ncbi:MAG: type II secretion system protein [Deltaproteobacteria bacterium]|nr:type II secretion system protein [Deltaproteobacteria bacterium]
MLTNQKGSSLVEIMVALVIFSIGLTMAMRSLPEGNAKTTRSRNMSIAVNLAQEKIEDLMSLPYNDADLNAGTHDDPDNPLDGHYERSWTVVADSPIEEMKSISVRVSFLTASSDSVRTLRTFISARQ